MSKRIPGAVRGRPKGSTRGVTPMVGVRLPESLTTDLKAMAEESGATLTDVVREACKAAVARWKRKKIKG